jgi:glutathione peroxidase
MINRTWISRFAVFSMLLGVSVCWSIANEKESQEGKELNAYSFKMKSLDGEEVDLSKYSGKVVLAVNVASRCGYTPQYAGLQELHEKYKDKGLAVIGVPCNQFGGQEPGTSKQIAEFCQSKYDVSFDMLEKVDVNGSQACELYQYLTAQETQPVGAGDVKWNFEKFLIGKDGKVIARFRSGTKPNDGELVNLIEKQLAAK